jgi:hypothetical protein
MKLTFEKTRGTRTIYFPLDRDGETQPEITVMIRPSCDHGFVGDDHFMAGVSFCNPIDSFSRKQGRAIAFERLNSERALIGSAEDIIGKILDKMSEIGSRRGAYTDDVDGLDFWDTPMEELYDMLGFKNLGEYFQTKQDNLEEQMKRTG